MRTGENNRDLTELEKKAGQEAAKQIGRKARAIIKRIHYPLGQDGIKNTGMMLRKTSAKARMKYDALDHIAITSTPSIFINHFGFEGIKSNGNRMSLRPTNAIDAILDASKSNMERLADQIADIRGEEVTSKIKW